MNFAFFLDNQKINPRKRLQSLDALKLLAYFLVVMHHCGWSTWGTVFSGVIVSILLVSMPIYCMVSGYSLIGRPLEKSTYRYVFKRILNIFKILITTEVIVLLFFCVLDGDSFSFKGAFNAFYDGFFLQRGLFLVTWFIFTLCVLYLLYPIINWLFIKKIRIFYGLMVCCLCLMTAVFITFFCRTEYALEFEATYLQQYKLYVWIFYFGLGGLVRKYRYDKKLKFFGNGWLTILWSILYMVLSWPDFLAYFDLPSVDCTYCSPLAILSSLGIFLYFLKKDFRHPLLAYVPYLFFPAFIIAEASRYVWERHLNWLPHDVGVLVLIPLCVLSGLGCAFILTRIPIIKNLLRA